MTLVTRTAVSYKKEKKRKTSDRYKTQKVKDVVTVIESKKKKGEKKNSEEYRDHRRSLMRLIRMGGRGLEFLSNR